MLRVSMSQWLLGRPEEKKKYKIKGDRGELAKNPLMHKLVFSLEFKNNNFRGSGNLLSFDVDESLYSELWSGYLFANFLNMYGSYKAQT